MYVVTVTTFQIFVSDRMAIECSMVESEEILS